MQTTSSTAPTSTATMSPTAPTSSPQQSSTTSRSASTGNGVSSISEVPEGATIIIPADDSNGTRALLLLQQEGLIELPEDASLEKGVTVLDIVDDHGYNVQAVQADTVPAQLKNSDEGTIAVINGNYALQAGYSVAKDALATENTDSEAA